MMTLRLKRWLAGLVLAALVATTIAPAAYAAPRYKGGQKHVRSVRYERHRPQPVVRYVPTRPHRIHQHARYHRYHDGRGLAFLGGFVLGTVISNAAYANPYFYADPYCDVRFSSLDAYRAHLRYHHHPAVVHVIEVRSGDWVDSYRCDDGGSWRYYDTEGWND